MSNLNAMLAAPGGSGAVRKGKGDEESAAASSSGEPAAESEASEPAPAITHAKRARVARKKPTKAADLQKAHLTTTFVEVKAEEAPKAQKITVVTTAQPKDSPKGGKTEPAAASSSSSSPAVVEPEVSLLAAAIDLPAAVVSEPPAQLDPTAKAAWSAAALYGQFDEPDFDESKGDDYRMLTAAGSTLLKHGASGKPHERVVFVTASLVLYYLEPSKRNKPDPKASINLSLFSIPKVTVVKGKTTANFKRSTAAKVDDARCFSIIAKERELDLECKSVDERDAWFAAIKYLLHIAQQKREAALLTSAMG